MNGTMLPRMWLVCMLSLPLLSPIVQARLGDDEAACDVRYNRHGGNRKEIAATDKYRQMVSGPNTATYQYSYEGWVIAIGFSEGKAVRPCYSHEAKGGKYTPMGPSKVSDEEAGAILNANAAGMTWRKVPAETLKNPSGNIKAVKEAVRPSQLWIRADGAIAYVSGSIVLSLYIADRDYVREKILVPAKAKTTPAAKPVPTF